MESGLEWIQQYGYAAIFLLLLLGIVGLPIPDETLLVFAGYLSFKGDLQAPLSLFSAALGSGCGITISYGLGRALGPRMKTSLGPRLRLTDQRLRAAEEWVNRRGKYALLAVYFVPGLRHLGAVALGSSNLRYPAFAACAYTGAFLWSGTFIAVGYILGEEWVTLSRLLHRTFTWMAFGAVTLAGLIVLGMLRRLTAPSQDGKTPAPR